MKLKTVCLELRTNSLAKNREYNFGEVTRVTRVFWMRIGHFIKLHNCLLLGNILSLH